MREQLKVELAMLRDSLYLVNLVVWSVDMLFGDVWFCKKKSVEVASRRVFQLPNGGLAFSSSSTLLLLNFCPIENIFVLGSESFVGPSSVFTCIGACWAPFSGQARSARMVASDSVEKSKDVVRETVLE